MLYDDDFVNNYISGLNILRKVLSNELFKVKMQLMRIILQLKVIKLNVHIRGMSNKYANWGHKNSSHFYILAIRKHCRGWNLANMKDDQGWWLHLLSETGEQSLLNVPVYSHGEGSIHRLESNMVAHNACDLSTAWEQCGRTQHLLFVLREEVFMVNNTFVIKKNNQEQDFDF